MSNLINLIPSYLATYLSTELGTTQLKLVFPFPSGGWYLSYTKKFKWTSNWNQINSRWTPDWQQNKTDKLQIRLQIRWTNKCQIKIWTSDLQRRDHQGNIWWTIRIRGTADEPHVNSRWTSQSYKYQVEIRGTSDKQMNIKLADEDKMNRLITNQYQYLGNSWLSRMKIHPSYPPLKVSFSWI